METAEDLLGTPFFVLFNKGETRKESAIQNGKESPKTASQTTTDTPFFLLQRTLHLLTNSMKEAEFLEEMLLGTLDPIYSEHSG